MGSSRLESNTAGGTKVMMSAPVVVSVSMPCPTQPASTVAVNASSSVIHCSGSGRDYLFPACELPACHQLEAGLIIRPLAREDYNAGFLQLLSQLTSVGEVSPDEWESQFSAMVANQGTYYVVVVEDRGAVVGAATLVKEKKFIHSCGAVGRVEDVVVSDQYRGRQLGKLLVNTVTRLAVSTGCYKVTLNCNDRMVPSTPGWATQQSRAMQTTSASGCRSGSQG